MSFGFAHPWALLLLPLIPAYLGYVGRWRRRALTFSRTNALGRIGGRAAGWLVRAPEALRAGAITLLIVALAAPRTGVSGVDIETEGIAIVLVLDISSSMLAEDFHPQNRFAVAKDKMAVFIRGRQHDRIGLIAFAGEALTQVPLTIDYPVLFRALDDVEIGDLEDGTAIGTGIATAANRLRRTPGESRVIILMTDGENNRGEIDPLTAARAAAAFDIKVYAIGIGSDGRARMPIGRRPGGRHYTNVPVHIDEDLLRKVADVSGGRYFRATNEAALDSVYRHIDRLEKTPVEIRRYVEYTPWHLPFILFAASMLLVEWAVRASRWGTVP